MKIKAKPVTALRGLTLYWAGLDPQISKETFNIYLHMAQQLHLQFHFKWRFAKHEIEISQNHRSDELQSLPSTFAYVTTFGIRTTVRREMPVSKIRASSRSSGSMGFFTVWSRTHCSDNRNCASEKSYFLVRKSFVRWPWVSSEEILHIKNASDMEILFSYIFERQNNSHWEMVFCERLEVDKLVVSNLLLCFHVIRCSNEVIQQGGNADLVFQSAIQMVTDCCIDGWVYST